MGIRFADIPQFTDQGSYAVDYPLHNLVQWVDRERAETGLNLCPDFQRGHVWTEAQQVDYVEFLLMGGQSGRDLYFNCPSWHTPVPDGAYNDYVCVDGLQRLTALTRFVNNEIRVCGHYFREFEDPRYLTAHCTICVHVNDLKTRREVLRWYLELNSGGTPHSQSELDRVEAMYIAEGCKDL